MGEFVDDIRAALVMNPNFCRLRYKKEESTRRNGFVKKEESAEPNNTVICSNVSIEDSNGNLCLQMKEVNSHRKVTFKDEPKRQPLRRRASDIEIREAQRVSSRKQNCAKCSPNILRIGDQPKLTLRRDPLEQMENLIDDNSVEEMDLEGDSKYGSSDTPSKDSLCDVEVQASETLPDTSTVLFKDQPVDMESSDSSYTRNGSDMISLDDILARYSTILDETSLQTLQKSTDTNHSKNRKRKPFTFLFFLAFVLTPTLLFYFLVFLYFFQPEPLYSVLLRNLKLKDDPQLSPLSSFLEFIKWASSELYDYTYEKLEELVTNFNEITN